MNELYYGAVLLCGMMFFSLGLKLAEVTPLRLMKSWNYEVESYRYCDLSPERFKLHWVVKLLTTLAFTATVAGLIFSYGITLIAATKVIFFSFIFILTIINQKHQIYPDTLIFPCLWLGLLSNSYLTENPSEFIYGAATGYLVLYSIYIAIKAKTGKDTIGFGDMKYFAMVGAWYGVSDMPSFFAIVVIATVYMLLPAIFHKSKRHSHGTGISYLVGCMYLEFFSKIDTNFWNLSL